MLALVAKSDYEFIRSILKTLEEKGGCTEYRVSKFAPALLSKNAARVATTHEVTKDLLDCVIMSAPHSFQKAMADCVNSAACWKKPN